MLITTPCRPVPSVSGPAGLVAGRQQVRNRGLGQPVRDPDVELERVRQVMRLRRQERPRHRAADVVHHDVQPPEGLRRGPGQAGRGVEVGQVGGNDDRPPPGRLDLPRDLGELVLGAGRDQHVRPGLASAIAVAAPIPRPAPVTTAAWR